MDIIEQTPFVFKPKYRCSERYKPENMYLTLYQRLNKLTMYLSRNAFLINKVFFIEGLKRKEFQDEKPKSILNIVRF